jgi:hypothetical protein
MYEVAHSDKKSPDGTDYNDPPINLREITEKDFAQSQFHSHSPSLIEYRQMILKEDLSPGKLTNGRMISAFLYWFGDDTGIAIASEHHKGKVRYFAFGCNHSLGQATYRAGATYHCKKCKSDVREGWMELIVEDSGWNLNGLTSRPSRGIRDYERTIRFSAPLSHSHLAMVVKFLRKVDCPGWTGVGCKDQGGGSYKFSTTYDSSD